MGWTGVGCPRFAPVEREQVPRGWWFGGFGRGNASMLARQVHPGAGPAGAPRARAAEDGMGGAGGGCPRFAPVEREQVPRGWWFGGFGRGHAPMLARQVRPGDRRAGPPRARRG